MPTDRRTWLKQSGFALAGLGISPILSATEKKYFFLPGNPILLNSNENAYGPSPLAQKAIMEVYKNSNRYPDDYIPLIKKKIAAHWNVATENILLGAGSSDIIGLACQHVAKTKGHIIIADPSYRVWNGQAASFGLSFKRIPLNDEKKTDLPRMVESVSNETRMIYFCNPNNPTGSFAEITQLKNYSLAAAEKTFVFIDEAYTEYAGLPSLATLAISNPNIVVAKTFSKVYGLAGARVGYAIAHPETIKSLSSYQPWPDAGVSVVSGVAAMASLDDQDFVKQCREKAKSAREMCYDCFKKLSLDYIPSSTNFILFNIDKIKGDFTSMMQAKNIYVQFREHFGGKWCRVSMGTIEEMQQFCNALKEIAS
ncbi:MAG TPA: aminotransferase class I/II-fold pyridoxal phosphate-dependent enzyme [Chitinophagaceae bacterium]|nr:aminotransferase class I/II-fold pyridoxal phosphate-dependent enzyme [Chitinophagaceae bacterium]